MILEARPAIIFISHYHDVRTYRFCVYRQTSFAHNLNIMICLQTDGIAIWMQEAILAISGFPNAAVYSLMRAVKQLVRIPVLIVDTSGSRI